METVPTDFGKRVYQGVRVKHTVKDLLAEKRSRQSSGSRFSGNSTAEENAAMGTVFPLYGFGSPETELNETPCTSSAPEEQMPLPQCFGSTSTSQSPFVQMPGSPATAGYYSIRRSFTTELDFHNTKQFVSDIYSSPLGSKPFSCDSSATQGYPALLDPYLTDQYGDYRAAPLTAGTSSFFSSSSVPPLLPSFPNDTAHFLLREPWEQTPPDNLGQSDGACSDPLQALPASASCLSAHESGGISPYRSSGWTPAITGTQPYPLHALEDVHYSPSYASTSSYSFSPFMTVANELTSRMSQLSPEQSSETPPLHDNSAWAKEDGSPIWGTYEGRRTY